MWNILIWKEKIKRKLIVRLFSVQQCTGIRYSETHLFSLFCSDFTLRLWCVKSASFWGQRLQEPFPVEETVINHVLPSTRRDAVLTSLLGCWNCSNHLHVLFELLDITRAHGNGKGSEAIAGKWVIISSRKATAVKHTVIRLNKRASESNLGTYSVA